MVVLRVSAWPVGAEPRETSPALSMTRAAKLYSSFCPDHKGLSPGGFGFSVAGSRSKHTCSEGRQPPPQPCPPGDNDGWQEEEREGEEAARLGGGAERGSSEDLTPSYLRHCRLRPGQGQVAGGGKRLKFTVKEQLPSFPVWLFLCALLQVGLTLGSSCGQTVQMQLYCVCKESSSWQTHFPMTPHFGSSLWEQCKIKEAGNL